jgi:hypothetical protein
MINIKWLFLDLLTFGCYSSYQRIKLMDEKYKYIFVKKKTINKTFNKKKYLT